MVFLGKKEAGDCRNKGRETELVRIWINWMAYFLLVYNLYTHTHTYDSKGQNSIPQSHRC